MASVLRLEQIAVHNYRDIGLPLPERCILQLHWYREPNFQAFVQEHGFRVVVAARHPLDVLVSVLAFVRHEPLTRRWLEGNCAIPAELVGSHPASHAFAQYATGFGAENLLSVSYQWWQEGEALKIRYEDFNRAPSDSFQTLLGALGEAPDGLDAALEMWDFKHFRSLGNRHGWQARPGLWRDLIPAREAREIYARHRIVFDTLGYSVRPKLLLSRRRAIRNWKAIA